MQRSPSTPLKPMTVVMSSAYAAFGLLLAVPAAHATDTINPSGTTITSMVTLVNSYQPSDRYVNDGTIQVNSSSAVYLSGTSLGALNNTGSISANSGFGVDMNNSTIATLSNSGTITAGGGAVYLGSAAGAGSTITSLINTGSISGGSYAVGVDVTGRIGTLSNSGVLSGVNNAVVTAGSVGTLNNTGVIQSPGLAIYAMTSGLNHIVNSGTIAGSIVSAQALTLSGDAVTQGTLTGNGGGIGVMTLSAGNLLFDSGKLLLNDNIRVSGRTVSNSGAALQVNNPVSITGNYTQAAGASLLIGVSDSAVATGSLAGDSGYGRLVVSGTANMASGTSIGLVRSGASYQFAAGQRYVVATASNGSTFNESLLHYSANGFSGSVTGSTVSSGSTSSLVLSLNGVQTNPGATTSNAVAALGGLANYGGTSGGLLALYNASMAIGSTAEANRVGEQLAPTQSTHAVSAASGATLDVLSVVGQHADSVRLADAGGGSGISAGDSYTDWQTWGQFFAGKASQGMIDGVSGFNANYNGVVAGADRMFGDSWRAGAAFSYSGTWVRGADNVSDNSSHVYSWGLVGYASYYGNPWYLNLSGSINLQNYHSTRQVTMTGYSDAANADFDGDQYVLKSELGYPLAGPWGSTVTPLTALSYSYQRQNGYTETSVNGSALQIGSAHAEAIRGSLGGKIDKSWSTRYGELTPSLQLLWTHQFNKSRMSVTSSYVADPSGDTSFTSQGATPVQDMADMSFGLTLRRASNLSLSLRYDRQDGAHYHAQTLSLRLRKQF